MHSEPSLWSFIVNAGIVVKIVLAILFCASILSWGIIIQRFFLFKNTFSNMGDFEQSFWAGPDLNKLYQHLSQRDPSGLAHIFCSGFREFRRLQDNPRSSTLETVIDAVKRAMRIVHSREMARLEQHLSFLATVGSISPYVGLFGTVWGIMTSFRALGSVQQASIAMVAPGISEALIATAVGLFAAIPAVIAYNRFSQSLEKAHQQSELFQEEFTAVLQRNLLTKETHAATV